MDVAVPVHRSHTISRAILRALTFVSSRQPVLTLAICISVAAFSVAYARKHLAFKATRADLIDVDTNYHQRWLTYTKAFGNVSEDMVVAVEGQTPEEIKKILDDLGQSLDNEPKLFSNVLYKVDPGTLPRRGLQYLQPQQLHTILARLDEFGPVLKGKWNLFTLQSLFRGFRHQISAVQEQAPDAAGTVTEPLVRQTAELASSLARYVHNPREFQSPWGELVPTDGNKHDQAGQVKYLLNKRETMGFLKVQPAIPRNNLKGASTSVTRLRELIADIREQHTHAQIGLTGIPVLECDEMTAGLDSLYNSSIAALICVTVLLVGGFRSVRHPLLAMLMLAVGIAWSSGVAAVTVGHLNLLSVTSVALLIGVGIGFAIVFISRYLELRHAGYPFFDALLETSDRVGPGIVTAAIVSAVAFFVAVLTDFAGVRELGLITGSGILLCCLSTFLVLPALLTLSDRDTDQESLPYPIEARMLRYVTMRHSSSIVMASCLALCGAAFFAFQVKYDYNLLHLQAKGQSSVEVQKRILEQADGSLLFAVSLANSPEQALELKRKFEALPTVHHVEEVASMLPPFPEEETQLLVQGVKAHLSQLPHEVPPASAIDPAVVGKQIEDLDKALAKLSGASAPAARQAIDQFLNILEKFPVDLQVDLLQGYQRRMTNDLLSRLKSLAAATETEPVKVTDLPPALASRFVSPQGKWLLQVHPKGAIWDIEPLKKFIADVRTVDPDATGTPLQTYEATREIKHSYEKVGLYALVAVLALLLVDLTSLRASLLALLPAAVGAALMLGILGWTGLHLDPVNLLVLPLIAGIGMDGGIQIMHDFRRQNHCYKPTASTVGAILLSSSTTIVGFGSLLFASHRGLYHLGLVLTIGVGSCLFASVMLLPAILAGTAKSRRHAVSARPKRSAPIVEVSFPQPPHVSPTAVRRKYAA